MIDLFTDPLGYFLSRILLIPGLLVAVTVHELAHALVADRLGDPTARRLGRLTLNPLPHIDPVGAIAFMLAGFGWAKPVPVNASNLRHPVRDMTLVAAAGPLSNFTVALVTLVAAPFVLGQLEGAMPKSATTIVGHVLREVYSLNVILGVFNLIPLPPLDGGHFLPYLLPRVSRSFINQLEQVGPFLLILLLLSGGTHYVLAPVVDAVDALLVSLARLVI
jgi:Zn-dependent protease